MWDLSTERNNYFKRTGVIVWQGKSNFSRFLQSSTVALNQLNSSPLKLCCLLQGFAHIFTYTYLHKPFLIGCNTKDVWHSIRSLTSMKVVIHYDYVLVSVYFILLTPSCLISVHMSPHPSPTAHFSLHHFYSSSLFPTYFPLFFNSLWPLWALSVSPP